MVLSATPSFLLRPDQERQDVIFDFVACIPHTLLRMSDTTLVPGGRVKQKQVNQTTASPRPRRAASQSVRGPHVNLFGDFPGVEEGPVVGFTERVSRCEWEHLGPLELRRVGTLAASRVDSATPQRHPGPGIGSRTDQDGDGLWSRVACFGGSDKLTRWDDETTRTSGPLPRPMKTHNMGVRMRERERGSRQLS